MFQYALSNTSSFLRLGHSCSWLIPFFPFNNIKKKSNRCKERKNNQCDPFGVSESTTYSQVILLILLGFIVLRCKNNAGVILEIQK